MNPAPWLKISVAYVLLRLFPRLVPSLAGTRDLEPPQAGVGLPAFCHNVCLRLGTIHRLAPRTLLHTVHNTVYTIQCTQYSVHYTVYTIQCTLYSVHCTVYTIQYTLYSVCIVWGIKSAPSGHLSPFHTYCLAADCEFGEKEMVNL